MSTLLFNVLVTVSLGGHLKEPNTIWAPPSGCVCVIKDLMKVPGGGYGKYDLWGFPHADRCGDYDLSGTKWCYVDNKPSCWPHIKKGYKGTWFYAVECQAKIATAEKTCAHGQDTAKDGCTCANTANTLAVFQGTTVCQDTTYRFCAATKTITTDGCKCDATTHRLTGSMCAPKPDCNDHVATAACENAEATIKGYCSSEYAPKFCKKTCNLCKNDAATDAADAASAVATEPAVSTETSEHTETAPAATGQDAAPSENVVEAAGTCGLTDAEIKNAIDLWKTILGTSECGSPYQESLLQRLYQNPQALHKSFSRKGLEKTDLGKLRKKEWTFWTNLLGRDGQPGYLEKGPDGVKKAKFEIAKLGKRHEDYLPELASEDEKMNWLDLFFEALTENLKTYNGDESQIEAWRKLSSFMKTHWFGYKCCSEDCPFSCLREEISSDSKICGNHSNEESLEYNCDECSNRWNMGKNCKVNGDSGACFEGACVLKCDNANTAEDECSECANDNRKGQSCLVLDLRGQVAVSGMCNGLTDGRCIEDAASEDAAGAEQAAENGDANEDAASEDAAIRYEEAPVSVDSTNSHFLASSDNEGECQSFNGNSSECKQAAGCFWFPEIKICSKDEYGDCEVLGKDPCDANDNKCSWSEEHELCIGLVNPVNAISPSGANAQTWKETKKKGCFGLETKEQEDKEGPTVFQCNSGESFEACRNRLIESCQNKCEEDRSCVGYGIPTQKTPAANPLDFNFVTNFAARYGCQLCQDGQRTYDRVWWSSFMKPPCYSHKKLKATNVDSEGDLKSLQQAVLPFKEILTKLRHSASDGDKVQILKSEIDKITQLKKKIYQERRTALEEYHDDKKLASWDKTRHRLYHSFEDAAGDARKEIKQLKIKIQQGQFKSSDYDTCL